MGLNANIAGESNVESGRKSELTDSGGSGDSGNALDFMSSVDNTRAGAGSQSPERGGSADSEGAGAITSLEAGSQLRSDVRAREGGGQTGERTLDRDGEANPNEAAERSTVAGKTPEAAPALDALGLPLVEIVMTPEDRAPSGDRQRQAESSSRGEQQGSGERSAVSEPGAAGDRGDHQPMERTEQAESSLELAETGDSALPHDNLFSMSNWMPMDFSPGRAGEAAAGRNVESGAEAQAGSKEPVGRPARPADIADDEAERCIERVISLLPAGLKMALSDKLELLRERLA